MFPNIADGPGFEEWRTDFEKTRIALWTLSPLKQQLLMNLREFEVQIQQHWMSAEAVDQFLVQVGVIDKRLKDIDAQNLLKQPYSISRRVSVPWLVLLSALAFGLGVILPLFLLAVSFPASKLGALVILFAALAFTLGSIIQFGNDLVPKKPERREYLAARWYRPLLTALDTSLLTAEHAHYMSLDLFLEAQSSPDFPQFAQPVSENLQKFIAAANTYDKSAIAWNKKIIAVMKTDSTLGRLSSLTIQGRSGSVMPPADIFIEERVRTISERPRPIPMVLSLFKPTTYLVLCSNYPWTNSAKIHQNL